MARYDAVFVGSGINSLAGAALLAKAGWKVCVLERNDWLGGAIRTVEGLADGEALNPLQRQFHENHALQCGFCTPGMIMQALDLLSEDPEPDAEHIREGLEGNLCRCTGYQNIVRAVQQAAGEMRTGGNGHTSPAEVDTAAAPHVAGAQQ